MGVTELNLPYQGSMVAVEISDEMGLGTDGTWQYYLVNEI